MTESTTTAAEPRRSAGQWALVAILGILGILAFVAAILFITGAANHIHFLSGSSHHGVHDIRLAVSVVAGVLLLAAAGYLAKSSAKSLSTRPETCRADSGSARFADHAPSPAR